MNPKITCPRGWLVWRSRISRSYGWSWACVVKIRRKTLSLYLFQRTSCCWVNVFFSSYSWCVCSLVWCSGVGGNQWLWCRWGIPLSRCLCCGWEPDRHALWTWWRRRSPRRRQRGCRKSGRYAVPWPLWPELVHSRTHLGEKKEGERVIKCLQSSGKVKDWFFFSV